MSTFNAFNILHFKENVLKSCISLTGLSYLLEICNKRTRYQRLGEIFKTQYRQRLFWYIPYSCNVTVRCYWTEIAGFKLIYFEEVIYVIYYTVFKNIIMILSNTDFF